MCVERGGGRLPPPRPRGKGATRHPYHVHIAMAFRESIPACRASRRPFYVMRGRPVHPYALKSPPSSSFTAGWTPIVAPSIVTTSWILSESLWRPALPHPDCFLLHPPSDRPPHPLFGGVAAPRLLLHPTPLVPTPYVDPPSSRPTPFVPLSPFAAAQPRAGRRVSGADGGRRRWSPASRAGPAAPQGSHFGRGPRPKNRPLRSGPPLPPPPSCPLPRALRGAD